MVVRGFINIIYRNPPASPCIIAPLRMHQIPHLELPTVVLLLLSAINLWAIGMATCRSEPESSTQMNSRRHELGAIALFLVGLSQTVYVVDVLAWLFRWIRFYPGAPIETFAMYSGLLLSVTALLIAPFAIGLRRLVGVGVALITSAMWLLAAAVSVAL